MTPEQTLILEIAHYGFGTGRFRHTEDLHPVAIGLAEQGYLWKDADEADVATFRMTPKGRRAGTKLFGQVSIRGWHRR